MSDKVSLDPWWLTMRQPIKNTSENAITVYGPQPARTLLPGEEALFEWKDDQWQEVQP